MGARARTALAVVAAACVIGGGTAAYAAITGSSTTATTPTQSQSSTTPSTGTTPSTTNPSTIARTCRASDRIDDRGPRQAGGGRRLLGRDCERLADPGDGVAAPKRPVVTAGAQPEHHGRESGVAQLGRELDVLLAEERVVGADVERDGVACPRALDADHDRLTARRLDGRGELLDRAVRRRRRRHRGGSR